MAFKKTIKCHKIMENYHKKSHKNFNLKYNISNYLFIDNVDKKR